MRNPRQQRWSDLPKVKHLLRGWAGIKDEISVDLNTFPMPSPAKGRAQDLMTRGLLFRGKKLANHCEITRGRGEDLKGMQRREEKVGKRERGKGMWREEKHRERVHGQAVVSEANSASATFAEHKRFSDMATLWTWRAKMETILNHVRAEDPQHHKVTNTVLFQIRRVTYLLTMAIWPPVNILTS